MQVPGVYYPTYLPMYLPDAEEQEDEPQMADILGWGRRECSSREWESETHAQYTYAAVPQYFALPGTTAQSPQPAGGIAGTPAAEEAPATAQPDLHPPAGAAAVEPQGLPPSRVAGAVQVPARRSRHKPPFHLYGHGNIRPTVRESCSTRFRTQFLFQAPCEPALAALVDSHSLVPPIARAVRWSRVR